MTAIQHVFDAEHALADGLSMLRESLRDMFSTVIRGEGGSVPRTRGRPHTNEAPARQGTGQGAGTNVRPNAGANGKPSPGTGLIEEDTVPISKSAVAGTLTGTLVDSGPPGEPAQQEPP